jgi:hypothetical protein
MYSTAILSHLVNESTKASGIFRGGGPSGEKGGGSARPQVQARTESFT